MAQGDHMTDLEITKLCAEAMGHTPVSGTDGIGNVMIWTHTGKTPTTIGAQIYDPLHDDAQAMVLVKKYQLHITPPEESDEWIVTGVSRFSGSHDLNRAICECAAKMQKAKHVPTDSTLGREKSQSGEGNPNGGTASVGEPG